MNKLYLFFACFGFLANLTAFEPIKIPQNPSISELDAIMLVGGEYRSEITGSPEWRAETQRRLEAILNLARVRLSAISPTGTLPEQLSANLLLMLQRERELNGYKAFYHGCNSRYAIFLRINQLLHEQRYGRPLSADMQLLRAKGSRRALEKDFAGRYSPASPCGDFDLKTAEELLSVTHTPFAGLSVAYEGPLFFAIKNFSVADRVFCIFVVKLFKSYGYELSYADVNALIKKFQPQHGMMLQVFVDLSVVDEVVYNADAKGMPYRSESCMDLLSEKMEKFATWYASSARRPESRNEIFEQQERILLRQSLFDQPNPQVKIFKYDSFSEEEKAQLECICERLMMYAEETKSAQLNS